MKDVRFEQLKQWLQGKSTDKDSQRGLLATSEHLVGGQFSMPEPASSDASFRRYFRIQDASTQQSFILMDAPPEHEDCRPFIQVSKELVQMGLLVPEVLEQDLVQGFLLLKDLGSTTYLIELQRLREISGSQSQATIDQLYRQALQALAKLQSYNQQHQTSKRLPVYNDALLETEMNLFSDWLCREFLELPDMHQTLWWSQSKQVLKASALMQPVTYVHRDYHSRNLMVNANQPGILDFQDAVQGALSYDAVSLLRDCYIAWPQEQITQWQREYFLELVSANVIAKDEWSGFVQAMDLMGVQRHLKAAGIFARLFLRDGKAGYLPDVPQTLEYIVQVGAKYSQLGELTDWVESQVQPKFAEVFAQANPA